MSEAREEDALALILDAAQQAWEQGETLASWVERYPELTLQLGELALSLERQRVSAEPEQQESAAARRSFLQAMDALLEPPRAPDRQPH